MNKTLILKKLIKHLGYENDYEFAAFLGIAQNTLSGWRKRNTLDYELIISKCDNINGDFLLTGRLPIEKETEDKNIIRVSESEYGNSRIKELMDIIKDKSRIIELLEAENKSLKTDASRPNITKRVTHV